MSFETVRLASLSFRLKLSSYNFHPILLGLRRIGGPSLDLGRNHVGKELIGSLLKWLALAMTDIQENPVSGDRGSQEAFSHIRQWRAL